MDEYLVLTSPEAEDDLDEIWLFNRGRYGTDHADDYLRFLVDGIDELSGTWHDYRPRTEMGGLRAKTVKRSASGDGHILLFEVDHDRREVRVGHVFHTKMDIQRRLRRDR